MGLQSGPHNALALLKKDHTRIKHLFDDFEDSEERTEKHELALEAIAALKIHARLEEELFYPAMRKTGANGIMEEADEEHHVAKLLIAELEHMKGGEQNFDAKFMVLAEYVRHHIREEETKMFAKAEDSDLDLDALGGLMFERKQALLSSIVPRRPAAARARHGSIGA